jgi:DNA-binding transcriptional LysR family regulator
MNIEPIDLNLLHTFYEVARAGSVSRASRTLGRSQPAISHRLRALEDELGVLLFERVGRRLKLTAAGRLALARTQELLAASANLRRTLSATRDEVVGQLTIGTLPTLASQLLAQPLAGFMKQYEQLQLSFVFALGRELIDQLRAGSIDVALVIDHAAPPRLAVDELGDVEVAAILPTAWATKWGATVPVKELRQRRYLSWAGLADPTISAVEHYVRNHELFDERSARIPHIETMRELVAAGVGYSILPAYTAWADEARGRLALRRPRGLSVSVPLFALTRPSREEWPALTHVLELLREASARLR